jgi:Zn-dependent protease with chaperone function
MMFALRGLVVSLSTSFILYSFLSLAVCALWRGLSRYSHRIASAGMYSDALFALRCLPLVVALGLTLALALPSFLLLEPRSGKESMGIVALGLCLCGIAVMLAGGWNAAAVLRQTSRSVARWSAHSRVITSRALPDSQSFPLRQTSLPAPPLTAAGILHPEVWLSPAAESVLTERELLSALRHELIHVQRRDNLRKLLLRFLAFPGMAALESAWCESAEMAADDAAVRTPSEALDLATAMIKLSRLASPPPHAELTTALVHSPAELLKARVERLISWSDRPQPSQHSLFSRYAAVAFALCFVLGAANHGLLVWVHTATELLVR